MRRPISKAWGLALPGPVRVRVLERPRRGWPGAPVPHLLEPASTRSDPELPGWYTLPGRVLKGQVGFRKQNEIVGSQLCMSAPSWVSRLGPHVSLGLPAETLTACDLRPGLGFAEGLPTR